MNKREDVKNKFWRLWAAQDCKRSSRFCRQIKRQIGNTNIFHAHSFAYQTYLSPIFMHHILRIWAIACSPVGIACMHGTISIRVPSVGPNFPHNNVHYDRSTHIYVHVCVFVVHIDLWCLRYVFSSCSMQFAPRLSSRYSRTEPFMRPARLGSGLNASSLVSVSGNRRNAIVVRCRSHSHDTRWCALVVRSVRLPVMSCVWTCNLPYIMRMYKFIIATLPNRESRLRQQIHICR